MKYINSVCDGCGLPFNENDDIVVCPECGTPQHRECYKKDGCCVNSHRHADGFEWSAGKSHTSYAVPEKSSEEEKLPCPSCGHLNPRDAKKCENCSMKLIVFGMNLAEASDQQRSPETDSTEGTDYAPPFVLGQGDGFQPEQKPQMSFPESISPQPGFPAPQYDNRTISHENARQLLLFRFLGSNAAKFISAFRKIDSGKGLTFNFAAFLTTLFFGPFWFFYRKLYKPGIILMAIYIAISIVFAPVLTPFLEAFAAYRYDLFTNPELFSQIEHLYPSVMAFSGATLALSLLSALIAYPLYKKHTENAVDKIMTAPSSEAGMALMSRLGGTSVLSPIACYFVINLILSFI